MSNLNTPISYRIKEEYKTPESFNDSGHWENFKCSKHPAFKVDALAINEDREDFKLLCIKCIIEGQGYKVTEGDKLMTMKELIEKSL